MQIPGEADLFIIIGPVGDDFDRVAVGATRFAKTSFHRSPPWLVSTMIVRTSGKLIKIFATCRANGWPVSFTPAAYLINAVPLGTCCTKCCASSRPAGLTLRSMSPCGWGCEADDGEAGVVGGFLDRHRWVDEQAGAGAGEVPDREVIPRPENAFSGERVVVEVFAVASGVPVGLQPLEGPLLRPNGSFGAVVVHQDGAVVVGFDFLRGHPTFALGAVLAVDALGMPHQLVGDRIGHGDGADDDHDGVHVQRENGVSDRA